MNETKAIIIMILTFIVTALVFFYAAKVIASTCAAHKYLRDELNRINASITTRSHIMFIVSAAWFRITRGQRKFVIRAEPESLSPEEAPLGECPCNTCAINRLSKQIKVIGDELAEIRSRKQSS